MGLHRWGLHEQHVVLVHDHVGFIRVYVIRENDLDDGGFVEGYRRGIRVDRVVRMLNYFHIDPARVEFMGRESIEGEGAEIAQMLYDWLEPKWLRRLKEREQQ